MQIPQEVNQRIQNAARDLSFARSQLEKAHGDEAIKQALERFNQCEQEMLNASTYINRGDYRQRDV